MVETLYKYLPFILTLGSVLGIAGTAFFLFRKNTTGTKDFIEKTVLHKVFNKETDNKIQSIQAEKVQVTTKIEDLKDVDVQTQKEISTIINDTAIKINELKNNSVTVKKVDVEVDSGWDKL
jgi:hypothetical protein